MKILWRDLQSSDTSISEYAIAWNMSVLLFSLEYGMLLALSEEKRALQQDKVKLDYFWSY